ncbi:M16 family metallopeptidase [Avibacterium paragallinarum]|uniref:M16 family metallopeptidase n=1 Tax=Avibacterium paragallinarum TaxID=728 RepID=UPI0039861CF1
MKKLTALFFIFFILSACQINTKEQLSMPLPSDPNLQYGKLENGLTYYIMKNVEPANRVYIRLVVNAGSMHEEEDQKGIAHLVEHMAFNGSKKYPENQIIYALEKLGMKFARDINAFTDFENTVYTLNLDKNDPESFTLAFDVLNEWIHHLTILKKDLDAERGVVEEEWRRRLSPMLRLGDKKSAIEMAGSRYILRDPIGDMNIIRTISQQRVADFYHKWYRPDNMSLIIVGDIDTKVIIKQLKQQLDIKKAINQPPIPKIDFSIPLINQWRLATVAEKGTNIPVIEFSFFELFDNKINTLSAYRQDLLQQILIRLINLCLQDWEKQENKNIESVNFYRTHLGRETIQNIFSLQLFNTDYKKVIRNLFNFIAEIKQQGFSKQEFEQEIKRLIQLNKKQRTLRSGSLKIADDLIISAANNQIVISPEDRYQLNQRFLNTISLEEINQQFEQLLAIKAKLLLITQPYPAGSLSLTQKNIENMWQEALSTKQQPWQIKTNHVQFPPLEIEYGEIKKIKYWKKGDITEYQLSNGSKLIYHYSDKMPNQVYFKAITQGGLRTVSPNDYHLFKTAVTLTDDSGINVLTLSQINQLFSQSPIAFATILDDYKQGFTAVGKTDQLESLLKLFRLKLQGTPVSENALERYKKETQEYITQIDTETLFMKKILEQRYPHIPFVYNAKPEQLLNFSTQQLTDFYHQTILGKTDFTYFIIGDIEQSKVENLARHYLSSVPVKKQQRQAYEISPQIPAKTLIMNGLKEPRADVEIYLTAKHQWQPELQYQLDLLSDILQEKLRRVLREQASGVYTIESWFTQEKEQSKIEGKIAFSCAPERVQELSQKTYQILDEISQNGIDSQFLQKKIQEKHRQIKQQFDTLLSVANIIEQSFWHTESNEEIYLYQHLEQIASKENIDLLAEKVLQPKARFRAVLMP